MATENERAQARALASTFGALATVLESIERAVTTLGGCGLDGEPLIDAVDRLSRASEHVRIVVAQLP